MAKNIKDRNMSSRAYNEKLADEIYSRIKTYIPTFKELIQNVEK